MQKEKQPVKPQGEQSAVVETHVPPDVNLAKGITIAEAHALQAQADAQFRNQCAVIAYTEIVRSFIAQNKAGQEGLAASWAFRFGDAMLERSKIEPKKSASVQVRGKAEVSLDEMPPGLNLGDYEKPVPPIAEDAPGLIPA